MKFYNQIKIGGLIAMLVTGISYADNHSCNGFQITVDNKLPSPVLVTDIKLIGATIQPNDFMKVDKYSQGVLTITNPKKDIIDGGMLLTTPTSVGQLPIQRSILFTLKNKLLVCEHIDKTLNEAGFPISDNRNLGGVTYTIGGGKE